jgi:hypothetical protein
MKNSRKEDKDDGKNSAAMQFQHKFKETTITMEQPSYP